jgi:hypothetical protein
MSPNSYVYKLTLRKIMKGFKETVTNPQLNILHDFGIIKAEITILIKQRYASS